MAGQIQTTNTGWLNTSLFNSGKKCVFPSGLTVEGTPKLECSQGIFNGKPADIIKDESDYLSYFAKFHDVITGTDKDTNIVFSGYNTVYNSGGGKKTHDYVTNDGAKFCTINNAWHVDNNGDWNNINAKTVNNKGDANNINAEYVDSEGDDNKFYNAKQVYIKKGINNKIVVPNLYSNATKNSYMFIIFAGKEVNKSKAFPWRTPENIPVDIPLKDLDTIDKIDRMSDKDSKKILKEIREWTKTTIIKDEGINTQIEIPVDNNKKDEGENSQIEAPISPD